MSKSKREYKKHEGSPGLGNQTPRDKRDYHNWYYRNVRNRNRETHEEKNARYRRYSETYWRQYCLENDLDPEAWEETKKRVQYEKAVRKSWRRGRGYWRR